MSLSDRLYSCGDTLQYVEHLVAYTYKKKQKKLTLSVIQARLTTCPGPPSCSSSQRFSCLGTLGSSPGFHIQGQGQQTGANSWRCAEGAWRLPLQMNHHRLIFNFRLLLPSSISASFCPVHTLFSLSLFPSVQPKVLQVCWCTGIY